MRVCSSHLLCVYVQYAINYINFRQSLLFKPLNLQQILLNNSAPIFVEEIVRTVPRQRIVLRGTWNGQAVFAKVFYGARAKQHFLRDLSGVNHLVAAHIVTPPLLHQDESSVDGEPAYVLVFAAITDAMNAEQLLAVSNQQERFNVAVNLVKVVASHHQANLLQTDLYPKNFLVTPQHVYTIDGDGIRHYAKLNKKLALQNLSLLLSKFDVLDMEYWFADLLAVYAQVRNWNAFPCQAKVRRLTSQYRQQICSMYADKKVFRQCTDVRVQKNRDSYMAVASEFASLPLGADTQSLDALMSNATLLKDGNTCTVVLARYNASAVVIKRYNIKSLMHRLNRMLRQTRAAVSWANAYRLQCFGIATPKPVALIEQRSFGLGRFGLKAKAYFLSDYVDAPDVADYFVQLSATESTEVERAQTARAEAVTALVELFYRLHLLKLSHGDMKFSNIKMLDTRPMLIDLDSMRQHHCQYFALKAHVKDLRRFMQNWKDDTSLYNAFLQAFKMVYADHTPLIKAKILSD